MGVYACILRAAVTLAVMAAGGALAADLAVETVKPECSCFVSTAVARSDAPVGALRDVSGRVVVSGQAAPRRGVAGGELLLNETVSTGRQSSALVRVGHCEQQLDGDQELTLRRTAGGICLIASSADPGVLAGYPISGRLAALGLGGLALAGGAIAASQSGGNGAWFTFGNDLPISR